MSNNHNGDNSDVDAIVSLGLAILGAIPITITILNEIKKSEFVMPNIPCKVTDDKTHWWDTVSENNGWRVQRNIVTNHYRLLDPDNIRRAWGNESGMTKMFESLSKNITT